jgi:hypothetical protein
MTRVSGGRQYDYLGILHRAFLRAILRACWPGELRDKKERLTLKAMLNMLATRKRGVWR